MSQYKVIIKEEAQADLKDLLRYEPKAYKKALQGAMQKGAVSMDVKCRITGR